ncbi:MAG: hypothetical protein KHZ87_07270 [Clostridiales bacterium]|nr:hypothetical protein [Clostridiales bacterium]MBS5877303.1 hypothetical protein [Clostridiales bacterium]MDU0939145.1 hypothetical protein [Clostridiales bacterium]MDU1042210.1 hypothetical protein [Clostridiales bacterium]MDU3490947.1 hypothetical protein [Clostridiales bacterium]
MKRFFSALIAIGAVTGLLFLFSAPVNVHHEDSHGEAHNESHEDNGHERTPEKAGNNSTH